MARQKAQAHLPEMEPQRDPEVHQAIETYELAKAEHKLATTALIDAKGNLRQVLTAKGYDADHGYLDDEFEARLIEDLKIKTKRVGGTEEE